MNTLQIELTDEQLTNLRSLARQRRTSPEQIVREAAVSLAGASADAEQRRLAEWREAALRMAGMWKDRDDLPDPAELRQSWDRSQPDRCESGFRVGG